MILYPYSKITKVSITTEIAKQQIEVIFHALHRLRHSTSNQNPHRRWER